MVLQTQNDAAFLGGGQALFDASYDPFEGISLGVAGQRGLNTAIFHKLVEAPGGAPSAGIDAHCGYSEFICELDAFDGMVDVFLSDVLVGRDESLMGSKATEVKSVGEGPALEALEVAVGLVCHLNMQYLDAVKSHAGGIFNAVFNGQLRILAKPPKGVSGDCDTIRT